MTTLAAAAVFLAWKRITSRSDKIFVVGYALLNALIPSGAARIFTNTTFSGLTPLCKRT